MTTRRDISLNVIADISKYQQQFSKVPGFTDKQAAKAAEKLEKRMSKAAADSARAAQKAAQKSARAFEKAGNGPRGLAASLDNVAEKSGDVDSILSGLGGALGAIDPRLQAVATGFGDAAGGIEAVSKAGMLSLPAMGVIGVAVAALGAAYLVLAHDVEEAEKAQERAAKRAVAAQNAFNGFTVSIRALDLEIAKLTGSYDANEEAAKKREVQFNRQSQAAERFLTKEIAATKAEQDRLRALQRSGDASTATTNALREANRELSRQTGQLSAVRDRAEDFRLENEFLAEVLHDRKVEEEGAKEASEALKRADEGAARAAERLAEAQRKQAEQEASFKKRFEERNAQFARDIELRKKSAQVVVEATAVELSAMGKLAQATDQQLAKAEEIRRQRIENAGTDRAMELQAEQDFQVAQTAIVEQYERERSAILKEETDKRKQYIQDQDDLQRKTIENFAMLAISSAAQATATISQILADEGQRKRARQAFQLAKALNVAMVIMETIRASRGALLPPPAGFGAVLGPVAAGVIAASGAVQVAAIRRQKPPTFYRGTAMVERPDGGAADAVPATLHAGEAVLNRRAAESMGRGQIEAMNAGRRSSGSQVVAISQINHRQFRSFYRDDRSLPGSLTRRDRNRDGTKIGRQL